MQQFLTLLLKERMRLARELQHSDIERAGKSGEGEQDLDRRLANDSSKSAPTSWRNSAAAALLSRLLISAVSVLT